MRRASHSGEALFRFAASQKELEINKTFKSIYRLSIFLYSCSQCQLSDDC